MPLRFQRRLPIPTVPRPGSVFCAFGASVEDPWTNTASGAQGNVRTYLCQRFGWTDTGRGTSASDTTRTAIGATRLQAGGTVGPDGISSYAARLTARNPAVILWGYGGNDVRAATEPGSANPSTPANFRASLRTVLAACAALATKPLIIIPSLRSYNAVSTFPSYATSTVDLEWQFNEILRQETGNYGNTLWVNMRDMPLTLYETNDIHPLPTTGHQWMADRITAAFGMF